ncbi:site-specific integrase [Belnapia sp. T18]|uniref:Site-specific integrase n=1 Tax=Belnapia arida TaxID=2804533 RepID=A0ABS1U9H2_9PROT|nr:site-specific integrase [Belnapia arida]MBL6081332.1 site-specific integrase [Belnapia arida]
MNLFEWAVAQDVIAPVLENNLPLISATITAVATPLPQPSPALIAINDVANAADGPRPVARSGQLPPASFAISLATLEAERRMPPDTLSRWKSDVEQAATWIGLSPETLPTAPAALVPYLEKVKVGAKLGNRRLKAKHWSNLQSSLRAVASAVGVLPPKRDRHMPLTLSPPWQARVGHLPCTSRSPLMSLVRWCDSCNIGPDEVPADVLKEYGRWRAANSYTKHLPQVLQSIRMRWNSCQRRVPGWPQQRLTSPGLQPRPRNLPATAFPSTFQDSFDAFLAGLRATKPLEGRGRALAEPTIALYGSKILLAATILAGQRGGPQAVPNVDCLATPEAMRLILLQRYHADGDTWTPTAVHLATVLVGLARNHLGLDDTALAPLRALQRKVLTPRAGRLPEKVRDRLAQFDDLQLRRALFTLADKLCTEAEEMRKEKPYQAAAHHRRGILLHLLLRSAMRRRNLIALNLQDDFVRDQRGEVTGIRAKHTKNGITIQAEFPHALSRLFKRHCAVFRPNLPGASSCWFVPSPDGTRHGSIDAQSAKLAQLVRKRLGADFNLHLTRHIVATILYEEDGDNSVLVQRTLGHTEVKTTTRMYGEISTAGAHHKWSEAIDDLVKQKIRRRRTGKQG